MNPATLDSFCLYSLASVREPYVPATHWGYAIVYNPVICSDGSLRSGYVKLDTKTLGKEVSSNRYYDINELGYEVSECLGQPIVDGFTGRYINGWYHKDELRTLGNGGCIEFACYAYDLPHTIMFLQRLRKDKSEFVFRLYTGQGASDEVLADIQRVDTLAMLKYSVVDDGYVVNIRFYKVESKEIVPSDLQTYRLDHRRFESVREAITELGQLVGSTIGEGQGEILVSSGVGHAIMDYIEYNIG